MNKVLYRAEIDGMRAIAIVSVLVYHLNESWLTGGFLGVDIFFVISGFLITAKLLRELEDETFSMKTFLKGRFKRLMPALLVMVSVTLILGAVLMEGAERSSMIAQALAAVLSFENLFLWLTTDGYWSNTVEQMPLLHVWSLSLEEQFYLLFPLLLLLSSSKHRIRWVLGVLFFMSLTLSVFYTPIDSIGAFFLLPVRMWELLMGAMLAAYNIEKKVSVELLKKYGGAIAGVGLALVAWSLVFLEKGVSFPGAIPFVCCFGASLMLLGFKENGILKILLRSRPLVYLGKISYSLYLWHWPIIVFSKFLYPETPYVLLVVVTFILAVLSYYLIEIPFRHGRYVGSKCYVVLLGLVGLSFIPLVFIDKPLYLSDRIVWNAESPLSYGKEFDAAESLYTGRGALVLNEVGDEDGEVCIIGSSHARVYCKPLTQFANKNGLYLTSLASAGASLVKNINLNESWLKKEEELNVLRKKYINSKNFKLIIVGDIWTSQVDNPNFEGEFTNWLELLSRQSEHVVILGQPPLIDLPSGYRGALKKYAIAMSKAGEELVLQPDQAGKKSNEKVKSLVDKVKLGNIRFVEVDRLFINEENKVILFRNGFVQYSDQNHLSENGATFCFKNRIYKEIERLW